MAAGQVLVGRRLQRQLGGEVTGDEPPGGAIHLGKGRLPFPAPLHRVAAAGMEGASRRRVGGIRHLAGEQDVIGLDLRVRRRDGGH